MGRRNAVYFASGGRELVTSKADRDGNRWKLAEGFIYEHIKEAPQQQIEYAAQLDDKILRVFGAASITIGLLGLSAANNTAGTKNLDSACPTDPLHTYCSLDV